MTHEKALEAATKQIIGAMQLHDFGRQIGDGYCLVKRPVGMHTNGGCTCWRDKYKAQRMMGAGQRLRAAIRSIGRKP